MAIVTKPKKVNKDWGSELWLAKNQENNYCGKILYINPGHSTSMHFHSDKHETFYILEGELNVETVNTETTERTNYLLEEGDTFEIDRLVPHQLSTSNSSVRFIEISTFHRDSDSYRVNK